MAPIDITRIEQEARMLRARELQRIEGLVAARLRLYGRLLGASALSGLSLVAASLRPLFSWNPQATPNPDSDLLQRLNRLARSLFSWNPQAHRS